MAQKKHFTLKVYYALKVYFTLKAFFTLKVYLALCTKNALNNKSVVWIIRVFCTKKTLGLTILKRGGQRSVSRTEPTKVI